MKMTNEDIINNLSVIDDYVEAIRKFREAQTAMNYASDILNRVLSRTAVSCEIEDINNHIEDCVNEVTKYIGRTVVTIKNEIHAMGD